MSVFARSGGFYYDLCTMKQRLRLSLITCLACCINKELYKAIDYLQEQVRVLVEHQEKPDKRILLTNSQRRRVTASNTGCPLSRNQKKYCNEGRQNPSTISVAYEWRVTSAHECKRCLCAAQAAPTGAESQIIGEGLAFVRPGFPTSFVTHGL